MNSYSLFFFYYLTAFSAIHIIRNEFLFIYYTIFRVSITN